MAEIQEYLPQTSVPEGVGGVSANVEMAGAVGRGIERLGGDVSQAAMQIQRRAAQQESSQVYSHIADLSSDLGNQVQQGIQDGSLDQEKILKSFDDANQQMSDKLDTPQAQNYLNRLQSRFRGHLMHTMSVGMSQIARNQAIGGMIDARNKIGNALFQDPASFQDQYEAGLEDIDQRIQTGGLPEKMRDKATSDMGSDFATQAVRGWANLDTDKARLLLNGDPTKDQKPAFDDYLSPDKKFQLNKEIDQRDRQNDIEDRRQTKAVQDDQKAGAEKWSSDNFKKWMDNSLSTKEVTGAVKDGTLTAEQGEKWVRLINERQKDTERPNHTLFNALASRIVDPAAQTPIKNIEDISTYVGHGINPTQFNQLKNLLKQTPEEQAAAQGEKALFDSAKKTIRFKNVMTQQYDVMGEQKLAQFMADYGQAKQKVKQGGGDPSDLVNPNSNLYFGSGLEKYQTSMQDQLSHMSQDRTNKALGVAHDGNNEAPKNIDKNVRKAGESAADFLKRVGK